MKCVQTKDKVLRLNEEAAEKMVCEGSGRYTTRLAWKNANPSEHQANIKRDQQLNAAATVRKEAAKKKLETGN